MSPSLVIIVNISGSPFSVLYDNDNRIQGQSMIQLEFCAFARKDEHNVYSLVPNIPVCIYILTKVVVGQQSIRTLFKSLTQLFL